ncbi:MAG: Uma2 family endonuclease [Acidobacteria bacterium]|nr:Uma2 family endonuclease [Acidobacteriota bacterium]
MSAPRLRTDEYLRMPETLIPQELVYGLVREAAAPTPKHQQAVGEFFFHLRLHLIAHPTGRVWMSPIDVVLDGASDLVVQPDLVVVLHERLYLVTDRVWGAPDVAIEVMSPRPRIGTLDERLAWFAQYGVRECWLVHQPDQECEIVTFAGGGIAARRLFGPRQPLRSSVLPQFIKSPGEILAATAI